MKSNYTSTILIALVVGVAAFFGGIHFQKMQAPARSQFTQFAGRGGGNGMPAGTQVRNGFNGGRIVGEILSVDANGITVKLQDGSSKIVLLDDKTTIDKSSTGTKDDLQTGITVAAFGTTNSDGSVTATDVQVNPTLMFGRPSAQPAK
jgi:hypothetical protein